MLAGLKFDSQFSSKINSMISLWPKLVFMAFEWAVNYQFQAKKKKNVLSTCSQTYHHLQILHHYNKIHGKSAYYIGGNLINWLIYILPTHVCDIITAYLQKWLHINEQTKCFKYYPHLLYICLSIYESERLSRCVKLHLSLINFP